MPDTKITALTAIGANPIIPSTFPIPMVDLTDTSMAASGTTKKVTVNQILGAGGTATLASATITGDLTVRSGNKLILNRADNAISSQLFDAGGGAGLTVNNLNGDGFLLKVASNNVYQVGSGYIQTWFDGAGGTRMTLNSTGLGVGTSTHSTRLGVVDTVNTFAATFRGNLGTDFVAIGTTALGASINGYTAGFGAASNLVLQPNGGNVGIGVAPASGKKLDVKSDGTTNTTFAAQFRDSADAVLFSVRSDGYFNTGSSSLSPYNNTTASAANMFVDSSGFVYRSTSSLKYKTDVKDSIHGLADVLKLRPVTYKSKNGDDTVFGGLIAEEVHAAGLTEFVAYAPDNTPDAIHYSNMVSLLVSAIKELAAEVNALKNA